MLCAGVSGICSKMESLRNSAVLGSLRPWLKMNSSEDQPREKSWERFQKMPITEKRTFYKCKEHYKTLKDLQVWSAFMQYQFRFRNPSFQRDLEENHFLARAEINEKVSLWQGDITSLEIDAIVNAANSSLLGGGGVDGCIHRAAGPSLKEECRSLNGCRTGEAKITSGHRLPAKYIIHTVGPVDRRSEALKSCYANCLDIVLKRQLKSIAFCCVATGVYGYPHREAADIALRTVRTWMEDHHDKVERVIFCTFDNVDFKIYEELMAMTYFPYSETRVPPGQPGNSSEVRPCKEQSNDPNRDVDAGERCMSQDCHDADAALTEANKALGNNGATLLRAQDDDGEVDVPESVMSQDPYPAVDSVEIGDHEALLGNEVCAKRRALNKYPDVDADEAAMSQDCHPTPDHAAIEGNEVLNDVCGGAHAERANHVDEEQEKDSRKQ